MMDNFGFKFKPMYIVKRIHSPEWYLVVEANLSWQADNTIRRYWCRSIPARQEVGPNKSWEMIFGARDTRLVELLECELEFVPQK